MACYISRPEVVPGYKRGFFLFCVFMSCCSIFVFWLNISFPVLGLVSAVLAKRGRMVRYSMVFSLFIFNFRHFFR